VSIVPSSRARAIRGAANSSTGNETEVLCDLTATRCRRFTAIGAVLRISCDRSGSRQRIIDPLAGAGC
jgi:hypothetical protein